jgi:tRNA(His) 5'-end guanylyltransferase
VSSDTTALGDRMKLYEAATRSVLPRRTYTICRVDGRAFHGYLRYAAKPFDEAFMAVVDGTAAALCREMAGAVFAYAQSDEISLTTSSGASGTPCATPCRWQRRRTSPTSGSTG